MEIADIVINKNDFESEFFKNFGMTIENFEELNYFKQKELIEKVNKINMKQKRLLELKEQSVCYAKLKQLKEKVLSKKIK